MVFYSISRQFLYFPGIEQCQAAIVQWQEALLLDVLGFGSRKSSLTAGTSYILCYWINVQGA